MFRLMLYLNEINARIFAPSYSKTDLLSNYMYFINIATLESEILQKFQKENICNYSRMTLAVLGWLFIRMLFRSPYRKVLLMLAISVMVESKYACNVSFDRFRISYTVYHIPYMPSIFSVRK